MKTIKRKRKQRALMDEMIHALRAVDVVRRRIVHAIPEYHYEMTLVERAVDAYNKARNSKD